MSDSTTRPLKVRALSQRLQQVACKELGEETARVAQDIDHIKQWLKKQPHLTARTDDQWLLAFLRGCKFSLERTKAKLDMYYTMKTMLPEIFSNRDPMLPEIQELLSLGGHLPLPLLDDQGHRVVLARLREEPGKYKMEDMLKLTYMITDIMLLEDDDYIISGDVSLMDFQGATMQHLLQLTPALSKKITTIYQEAYPIRPQGVNYLHMPTGLYTLLNLVKTFLKEKLRNRLHVHGSDLSSLYKEIPQKNLPLEYGGEAGAMDDITATWKAKVESYRDWFLDDEQYKSNEKKRIGRPKTQDELFGLEGSFRQLEFD